MTRKSSKLSFQRRLESRKTLNIFKTLDSNFKPKSLFVFLVAACLLSACAASREQEEVVYIPRRPVIQKPGQSAKPAVPRSEPTQRPYTINGKTYYPLASEEGFVQEGIASWYGEDFHNRPTSCGEIYDMYGETAAHKTLPMHTFVRVTNLKNQEEIIVRINDRGPFVKERIIDLSLTCAKKLGMLENGTAPVRVEALGRKVIEKGEDVYITEDFTHGNFTLQVGAFMEKANAERLVDKLSERYANAHWVIYDSPKGRFYRVRTGKYDTLKAAETAREELPNFPDAFVIAE